MQMKGSIFRLARGILLHVRQQRRFQLCIQLHKYSMDFFRLKTI